MELESQIALVTGATGFVGSYIVKRLMRERMRIRVLVRQPLEVKGIESHLGDLTDAPSLQRAAAEARLVVHCAAAIWKDPEQLKRVNVDGTRLLLDAAVQGGCERFIHVSTGGVYAFEQRAVVDETTPLKQVGPPYHLSKVSAEEAVWEASKRGLPVTILRPHFILGVHPTASWSTLVAKRIAGGEFTLNGDGSGSWPYVYIENLADAVVLAARSPLAIAQAYNIVDGQTTAQEFTDRFRRWLHVPPFRYLKDVVPWCGIYKGEKAVRDLGYIPRVKYEDAMAETERYLMDIGVIRKY